MICLASFLNIRRIITPSGQTIIDYEAAEDTDLSVYHLCNASAFFCQTLNC